GKGDRIEGLITSFVPDLCRELGEYIDEIIEVSYDEALEAVRELARKEGILAGLSSGANIVGVRKALEHFKARKVVTIAADSMLRYPELLS
ncbi:MAG TPA: pyridoxal-phosphate dependent enzyme, partial [Pyrodictium sp.]|nr:pyridoxal-phosphate dependent enzyme [Pyrodictium sp.]